ncbi:DUF2125 domain-containing protein [Pseudogemmobacter humi]|uniref:DUF2125 domain-containing protein n=1 Tax=Pseudogemmobacter humi TaxID=2483812 RepID=A0A3P5WWM2_9RHOB|nr:DUF2125 domain-containing protein [Pseudogemmobacter humi]VDC26058.1 hypothetical protein XINFAN_01546 [Pseudogemmobacter humi]
MRWLLGIFGLFVVLWCGWWFAGRTLILDQSEKLIAEQRAAGAVVEMDSFGVKGFPSRFDLTAENPRYIAPDGRIAWEGGTLRLYAMSWKPWHVILGLPQSQLITTPDRMIRLESEALHASLRAAPDMDLPLAEARLTGSSLNIDATPGGVVQLGELALALRDAAADAAATHVYDIGIEAKRITPDPALTAALAAVDLPDMPATRLPAVIDRFHFDASLELSAPLDRHAGETRPRLLSVELRDLSLTWGDLTMVAQGRLMPDDQGFAAGRIGLTVTNWNQLPPLLVASGMVQPRMAPILGNMLRALANEAGTPDRLTIPLDLKDGWMSFGPLPLGPAPKLGAAEPPAG